MNVVKQWLRVMSLALLVACAGALAADDAATIKPDELVKKVANNVLKDLDANRAEYRKDPSKVRQLVDKHLLPYFDTTYAAQAVLAKHWRNATPEQRTRFIEAFYQSILQNYGEALIDFTPDRLQVLPYTGKPEDTSATVRTTVRRENGSKVPVNYSLRKTPQGWKAFDVQVEGVSYVKSFRTDFGSEVDQKGLDAVIQRLESQIASGTVKKPTSSS